MKVRLQNGQEGESNEAASTLSQWIIIHLVDGGSITEEMSKVDVYIARIDSWRNFAEAVRDHDIFFNELGFKENDTDSRIRGVGDLRFLVRDGTNDLDVVTAIHQGEYSLPYNLPNDAVIVDIGCHIGGFGIMCAKDLGLQDPRGFFFDALLENIQQVKANLVLNELDEQKHMPFYEAVGYGLSLNISQSPDKKHQFIGHESNGDEPCVRVPVIELRTILNRVQLFFSRSFISVLKLDCEGGEYGFLERATFDELRKVGWICGEYHNTLKPILSKLLVADFEQVPSEATHTFAFRNKSFGV